MAITSDDLRHIFTYHSPRPDQIPHYVALRQAALAYAQAVLDHTPACPDQTVAVRRIREVNMLANQSIALAPPPKADPDAP